MAALFGTKFGFNDAMFLEQIVSLSHGSHVAGTIIEAGRRRVKVHTISWDDFGQKTTDELGYPEIKSANPLEWLDAVRQHRFPGLIAMGRRCSDYLANLGPGVVNASMGVKLRPFLDLAETAYADMKAFDESIPASVVFLLANELYAYNTIPFLIPVAENPNILFVAAAGNDQENVDRTFNSPAILSRIFPNVVAVAAVDDQGRLANFSNFGRRSINVAAPGVNIESLGVAGNPPYHERNQHGGTICGGASGTVSKGTSRTLGHRIGEADRVRSDSQKW